MNLAFGAGCIRTARVDFRLKPADGFIVVAIEDFADTLKAAQAGQEWAVAILFDALQPPLVRFLAWQEPSVAEDLAGETWLAVAERIGDFEGGEGQFRAWIFGIARRRLADHRRRGARRKTAPVESGALEAVADVDDPATQVVEKLSTEEAIARMTAALPPDQAEVLMLRVVGGLTVDECAEAMDKRPGAVRVLQHRALRRLGRELASRSMLEV
jgi:RNA polymerase sigma-70 factor (ECF subfamily)